MNSLKKIAEMSQKLEQLKDSRSEFIKNLMAAFEREIYDLKQEAKKQSNYKTGQAVEISGYVMVLAGAGTIWIGQSKIKKLNNAANATLSYGVNGAGVALALKF